MTFKELISTPEFYDIFGLIIFSYLLSLGIYTLTSKKKFPKLIGVSLILIGIAGLIVDGIIVTKFWVLG